MTATGTDIPPPPITLDPGEGDGGGAYERITVNLTKAASGALAESAEMISNTRTDVVNKALVVYHLLLQVQAKSGGVVYLRDGDGAPLNRLRLL